jgi:hypothetical protein
VTCFKDGSLGRSSAFFPGIVPSRMFSANSLCLTVCPIWVASIFFKITVYCRNCNKMVSIIILWDHRRICGPSLTETSLCGAYLYTLLIVSWITAQDLWSTYGDWRRYTCAGFRTRFLYRGRPILPHQLRQFSDHGAWEAERFLGQLFLYINSWFCVVSVKERLLLLPVIWKCTSV